MNFCAVGALGRYWDCKKLTIRFDLLPGLYGSAKKAGDSPSNQSSVDAF